MSFIFHYYILLDITQHPTDATFCEGSNAVLNCSVFDTTDNNAANNTRWYTDENFSASVPSNMINNTHVGDVVISILTIKNVSLNDSGNGYFCVPALDTESDIGVISVAGKHSC